MSQKEEDKKVKRTIKNSPLNQNPQNFQKSDEIMKTEDRFNHQDDQTKDNNQNNQLGVNNINPQINIESSPAIYTRDQMPASPIQDQAQKIPINTQNNINEINQIRTDPIHNPPIITNQVDFPDNNRSQRTVIVLQSVLMVKTYKPFKMVCPYCTVMVTTVPEPKFNCGICWFYGYFSIFILPLFIYWCINVDFCCNEAFHYCPLCNRIIAQRIFY